MESSALSTALLRAFSAASISRRLVSINVRKPSGPIARNSRTAEADSLVAAIASLASDSLEDLFDESFVFASVQTETETVRTIAKPDTAKDLRIGCLSRQ